MERIEAFEAIKALEQFEAEKAVMDALRPRAGKNQPHIASIGAITYSMAG